MLKYLQRARDKVQGDIQDTRLLYLKGALFAVIALLCAAGILAELPSWRVALLLGLAVWSSCRFYYFLFYVIEKYADPGFRFAGLSSVLLYFWTRRKK
jgi:hypothetical protein